VDRDLFVPSLRADNLVFGLDDRAVSDRLSEVSGVAVGDGRTLAEALAAVAGRFVDGGARSAAISLPPGFLSVPFDRADFDRAVARALRGPGLSAQQAVVLHSGVMFLIAGLCRDAAIPFQLMCGVTRNAYPHGVHQGRDLPRAGDSLAGLLPLINAFPEVTFCLSVLSDSQIQELGSFGWIVQNIALSGHWWYLNVPGYIERDLTARLQSVPKTKLIGYYSDMYKLEFGLPKFNMYRRCLARVLARDFVEPGYGTEQDAVAIARLVLRENPARIFNV
jgi:glucuronate isomerase